MCGIFGLVVSESAGFTPALIHSTVDRLFVLSESRGKEASGIAIAYESAIDLYKQPIPASELIKTKGYQELYSRIFSESMLAQNGTLASPVAIVGHSRLVTNGSDTDNFNNQPIISNDMTAVHNGIVVNDAELWRENPDLTKQYEVDTEIILSLLRKNLSDGADWPASVSKTFREIRGATSVAVLAADNDYLTLATNNGSLYVCTDEKGILVFTSELFILNKLLHHKKLKSILGDAKASQIAAGTGALINIRNFAVERLSLVDKSAVVAKTKPTPKREIVDLSRPVKVSAKGKTLSLGILTAEEEAYVKSRPFPDLYDENVLRRCTRCLLPETMPFLQFDSAGVCNYCHNYKKIEVAGEAKLRDALAPYRGDGKKPDCIVAFSGGRDSCHGLHYLKTELGMNPIAYTYDWGMVTDLARRNSSRMLGDLGVEHVLVSADIRQKRAFIRKNLLAWLKKPDLGMIPLLMAGDKQFYYYANKLSEQTGVKLIIYCAGNELEKTYFKTGFCGIEEGTTSGTLKLSLSNKFRLLNYYFTQYATNPSYLNSSLVDTAFAYYSAYMAPHDAVFLYHYLPWDEASIMKTLKDEYQWETPTDSPVTWRIGDGTAAFYNYVYYVVAGITENDTFRSNQIREGSLTREAALAMVREENKPRYQAIKSYLDLIGVDLVSTLKVVDAMPRRYGKGMKARNVPNLHVPSYES